MEKKNELKFTGTGADFFGVLLVNVLLSVITLGLYYPWAQVKILNYMYPNTYFDNQPFKFTGNGKDIFKGYIKFLVCFIVIVGLFAAMMAIGSLAVIIGLIIYIGGLTLLVAIAIHGSMRYYTNNTLWRDIRLSYNGNFTEWIKIFVPGFLLTMITLGIYAPWFQVKYQEYMCRKTHMGNVNFKYTGDGGELFMIMLKGLLLSIITLGIYLFWLSSNLFKYQAKHTQMIKDGKAYTLNSEMKGSEVFSLEIVNVLIIIFTLGFGYAWARVRELKFMMKNVEIPADFDATSIIQRENITDPEPQDKSLDFLDFNIIV